MHRHKYSDLYVTMLLLYTRGYLKRVVFSIVQVNYELSSLDTVVCGCNHLTIFAASTLQTPNLIDATDISKFLTVYDNPLVVTFCAVSWAVFLLVALYAYRQGVHDENKVE